MLPNAPRVSVRTEDKVSWPRHAHCRPSERRVQQGSGEDEAHLSVIGGGEGGSARRAHATVQGGNREDHERERERGGRGGRTLQGRGGACAEMTRDPEIRVPRRSLCTGDRASARPRPCSPRVPLPRHMDLPCITGRLQSKLASLPGKSPSPVNPAQSTTPTTDPTPRAPRHAKIPLPRLCM